MKIMVKSKSFFKHQLPVRNAKPKGNPTKVDDYIFLAPMVFVEDSFYVVGGWTGSDNFDDTIGKLDAFSNWSKVGELRMGRHGHSVIFDGEYMLVVGGFGENLTEKCTFTAKGVNCYEQSPRLYNYEYYPELFLVPVDFCKSLP